MNASLNLFKLIPCSIGSLTAIFITFFNVPTLAQIAIPTPGNPIINSYAAVSGFDPFCGNTLTVEGTAGFQPGNTVMLIQMQGAQIDDAGNVTDLNGAGAYEKAIIAQIDGNSITFTKDLINYDTYITGEKVQMVKIPQFIGNVIVLDTTLTAAPWNGATGGVLAFEATGTVELRANINVNGKGFRGGGSTNNIGIFNDCKPFPFSSYNAYFYPRNGSDSIYYSFKGEGIAAIIPGRELGRGAQANGGGGGNDHNSGGGGGGNYGIGGRGGINDEPSLILCRGDYPGLGGNGINLRETIYLGGGGGGGHSNNRNSAGTTGGTAGANGGGIIYIGATAFNGNGRNISANGMSAIDGNGDGVGGGGAGGTVMLNVNQVITQPLSIQARGGNGASVDNQSLDRCFGPGGGGGGGKVFVSSAFDLTETNVNLLGGQPGTTFNSGVNCDDPGALPGSNGITIQPLSAFMPISDREPGCFTPTPVEYLYFTAKGQNSQVYLEWATAREKNNDYFSIERSENGKDFYEIAQVSGKGTYNDVSTYRLTDENPIYGVSYYRIKQVDYDRKSAYTGIEPVKLAAGEVMMSIFPNPVQNQQNLNINLFSPVAGEATLRIYTLLGDEKYAQEYTVIRGAQTLELPIENFAAGWYVVHIQVGNSYKTQKINVVR